MPKTFDIIVDGETKANVTACAAITTDKEEITVTLRWFPTFRFLFQVLSALLRGHWIEATIKGPGNVINDKEVVVATRTACPVRCPPTNRQEPSVAAVATSSLFERTLP